MKRIILCLMAALAITPSYSQDKSLHCLTKNIYFEARGEPVEGRIAVAMVTLNRVQSTKFPDSVCAVVYQPKQFSWTNTTHKVTDQKAWDESKRIAKKVLAGRHRIKLNALYFHANYVSPYWKQHFTKVATIGRHIFYV